MYNLHCFSVPLGGEKIKIFDLQAVFNLQFFSAFNTFYACKERGEKGRLFDEFCLLEENHLL